MRHSKVKKVKHKGQNRTMSQAKPKKDWNPQYVKYLLEPHFRQAEQHFLAPLLEVSRAHALMLWQSGLLELDHAKKICAALETVASETFTYSQNFEDLFFALEARLLALAGTDAAGNLHIARSRNDTDAALIRMILRRETLEAIEVVTQIGVVLQTRALAGLTWLMPGYTHHQPAQPTTLGHYLSGILGVLERDLQRLKAAYSSINLSPLGAVAMTGTGFAINRQSVADWLGFESLLENGIDAVGASDHSLELLSALQICNTNLSRLVHDLIFWATQETGFFRVADSFVQISSIMPQKRNPVVLEHIRAKLARANGAAQTAFTMCHHIPFGDVNDVAEPLLPVVLSALEDSRAATGLLTAVLEISSFETAKMRHAAGKHFITATGLADALVGVGLTFKTAHTIVSRTIDNAVQHSLEPTQLTAEIVQSMTEIRLELTDQFVQGALNPQNFVERRTTLGGSAPSVVQVALEKAGLRLEQTKNWHSQKVQNLEMAQENLKTAVQNLLEQP